MDFEIFEDLLLIVARGAIIAIHTLHLVGFVAGGALAAVTLIWTVEEIFEVHKGARQLRSRTHSESSHSKMSL